MNAEQQAAKTTAAVLQVAEQEIAELDQWSIANDKDNEFAGEMLQNVIQRRKLLEAERKKITTPLLEAKRAVDALFKPPKQALETAERILKAEIAGYLEECEAADAKAYADAGAAKTVEAAEAALERVQATDAPKGVSVRHVWRTTVIDQSLLTQQFLMPDETAIKAWVKEHVDANGKPYAIPGVVFDREPIVTSRKVSV